MENSELKEVKKTLQLLKSKINQLKKKKNQRIVKYKGNKLKSLKYLVLTILTKKNSLLNQFKKKVK